jgi:hypothetical protein
LEEIKSQSEGKRYFYFAKHRPSKDTMKKRVLVTVVVLLALIQLFRPSKNVADDRISDNDISLKYDVPGEVHKILQLKCYDCHSNHTDYPWYYNIQPLAWWMAYHINEGKEELNFSAFKNYDPKRAAHKLDEVREVLEDHSMPLDSYTLMHPERRLTSEETSLIISWIIGLKTVGDQGR